MMKMMLSLMRLLIKLKMMNLIEKLMVVLINLVELKGSVSASDKTHKPVKRKFKYSPSGIAAKSLFEDFLQRR